MSELLQVNIHSEYAALKTVYAHKPSAEIDRLTLYNLDSLLFEDIPLLPNIREQHDNFVQTTWGEGINMLYLEELLLEIMRDESIWTNLVTTFCRAFAMPSLSNIILEKYQETVEITDILFQSLLSKKLLKKEVVGLGPSEHREDPFLLNTVSDSYFSREGEAVRPQGCSSLISQLDPIGACAWHSIVMPDQSSDELESEE